MKLTLPFLIDLNTMSASLIWTGLISINLLWDLVRTENGGVQGMTSKAPKVSRMPLCSPHNTNTTMMQMNLALSP